MINERSGDLEAGPAVTDTAPPRRTVPMVDAFGTTHYIYSDGTPLETSTSTGAALW